MLVSQEKAATIRDQLKVERQAWHHKPRYGLFSYLPDHDFGFRDNEFNTTKNFKDESGRVKTSPKNFQVGRPQTAHKQGDAFTKTGYLCLNDEYIDPNKIGRLRESRSTKNGQAATFRPSGGNFHKVKAPYEYLSDSVEPDRSGAPPKNFMTSPMKKGLGNTTAGHLFSSYAYLPDPYNNGAVLDSLERQQHADKKINGPFQLSFKKRDHFTTNRKVYYEPDELRGYHTRTTSNGFRPFLKGDLPKKGYNCTINKFPEYSEEGPQIKGVGSKTSEGFWKHTYKEKTVPTPSVKHYNAVNRPRNRF